MPPSLQAHHISAVMVNDSVSLDHSHSEVQVCVHLASGTQGLLREQRCISHVRLMLVVTVWSSIVALRCCPQIEQ